jgi:hypothetical protein
VRRGKFLDNKLFDMAVSNHHHSAEKSKAYITIILICTDKDIKKEGRQDSDTGKGSSRHSVTLMNSLIIVLNSILNR